jgi:UDP:flavonoid glycosyltransferase YjiC (YdhE family)
MRIAFAWEWGSGSGHIMRFSPLARQAIQDGHQLTLIVRDSKRTRNLLSTYQLNHANISVIESPAWPRCPRDQLRLPNCLSQIAWNLGFFDQTATNQQIRWWRDRMHELRPELVVQDFGVTAGLVAWTLGIPTLRIGTGYTCAPRTEIPASIPALSDVLSDSHTTTNQSAWESLRERIRTGCQTNDLNPPDRWHEIINGCEEDRIATVALLDPYAPVRPNARYCGVWPAASSAMNRSDRWATAIAYLKPFPAWELFFSALRQCGVRVDLVPDGVDASLLRTCDPAWVRVLDRFVPIEKAAQNQRHLINNGNHGTSALALLSGMAVITCPLFLEQRLTADAIETAGLGLRVNLHRPKNFLQRIDEAFGSNAFTENARHFSTSQRQLFLNAAPNRLTLAKC